MSEKAEAKPAAAAAAPPAADKGGHGKEEAGAKPKGKGGGLMSKTPILLGGVMLIEAVVLIGGFKFIAGGPKTAAAVELAADTASSEKGDGKGGAPVDNKAPVELQLVDFRAPNKTSGRTFLYDVNIVVTTKTATGDKVKDLISSRDALIKDRIRTIIATLDPEKLGGGSEPGLETLRRQVKYQLDQILGDGLIDDVLVPRCIPFRTDY
jgi:flagellar basal body-associated protein FliL